MIIFLILLAGLALLVVLIITLVSVEIKVERSGGEGKPILRELDLAQMEQLRRGPLTVYFSPGHQNLGQEVADVLEQAWRIVRERLDLDLGRFRSCRGGAQRGSRRNKPQKKDLDVVVYDCAHLDLSQLAKPPPSG